MKLGLGPDCKLSEKTGHSKEELERIAQCVLFRRGIRMGPELAKQANVSEVKTKKEQLLLEEKIVDI